MNGLSYQYISENADETKALAATLAPRLLAGDVLVLVGDLGAGKTQFTQGLGAELGVASEITSPTFNLCCAYTDGSLPLYHFDLYRLEQPEELDDIDYWATLEGDGVSVVEWGDKFPGDMPLDYLELSFTLDDAGRRVVRAHAYGQRARRLLTIWGNDSVQGFMEINE